MKLGFGAALCSSLYLTFVLTWVQPLLGQELVGDRYEGQPLVIVDVTVIDVTTGTATPHQVVVVRHGKIDHIKPAEGFAIPGWMTEVQGKGRFLIPGLWDAHVHLSFWEEPESGDMTADDVPDPDAYREVLGRHVGWGVTSVRDMGGDSRALDEWRSRIEKKEAFGPTIYRAGPYVDGPKPNDKYRLFVTNQKEAFEAARTLDSMGVDFMKIHSQVPAEVLPALVQEAKRVGLPVAGHVPYGTSIEDLVALGVASIEHVDALFISRLGSRQGSYEEWKAAYDWYSTPDGRALLGTMTAGPMWFTPTLAIFDSDWEGTPEPWINLRGWYRELVTLAHREGVGLLAGTDVARRTGAIQPGIGLHEELEDLVEIGLSPAEALRAATLNPARALGRAAETGSIEPGMTADLVLLNGNPLEEIGHTRAIEAVILRGRLLDETRLAGLRGARSD